MHLILIIIICAALILATGYTVWFLIQMRRTLLGVMSLSVLMSARLPALLRDLTAVSARINALSRTTERWQAQAGHLKSGLKHAATLAEVLASLVAIRGMMGARANRTHTLMSVMDLLRRR